MTIDRKIHKIDATGKAVGRLASQIAILLRGKNKPEFTPNIDNGDIVYVNNIKELKFTGKKLEKNLYKWHSGYPGGLKTAKLRDVYQKNPEQVLKKAVREMLPPIKARDAILKRLIIN